ncbi:chemotaxis protein CheB [Algoriphagus antarcticus]|uniref:histidine kinase n=1 Tax=Algoriphagus antarcticus TaxID=238540 RepID=A0A3E0DHU5_9BACT|nr:chemotaxis protein CheB [Algoriphagus antarcticus]REG82318.1 two-component system CheB/CheR fusion protein [Algoriphagus antarcticus]
MATLKKNKTQPPATEQNFPIVGIGASAGGLDAFRRLLTAIPESSGMAYVLVQHLDPSHESMLPEILQRVTNIPVHEITDDIHLAPNHIYIIPENKILTSTDGVLQLAPRDKNILNLSIDIFFTTLAEVHKEFAVGVILSGTGKDGTKGLKAIKEYGGISIAQDMESAGYFGMPESAINAGVVDFILAPEKIPEQLLQINSAYKTSHVFTEEKPPSKDEGDVFRQILSLLRQHSDVDFTHYKDPTLRRRIARRIAIVKKKNLTNYLKFLRIDKDEQEALFQDMLIPVTSFFRDPKTFDSLTETVFASILKNKKPDDSIRIWIAGCSTGEELYSIAICLQEFLGANPDSYRERTKIQIFASDISEKAIKKARAGVYTNADVEGLSASQLVNYFTKNNGGYEVSKLIRDMCVIAHHNFLKDPPFAKMDLISCRNVLIYMDTFLQQKAFATFHYALKENGFLLLGKSESIGASSDLFLQAAKNEKIYSRKQVTGKFRSIATEQKQESLKTKVKTVVKHEATQTDFKKSAEAIMIAKSPASVVVNEQMDIVHIHGDLTPFLQSPQGKPTHNLLSMARDGLGFELRNAIHKATKEQVAVIKENIPLKLNATMNDSDSDQDGHGKQTLVTIEIIPLTDTFERHYLIRFEKMIVPKAKDEKSASSGKTQAGEAEKRNEQLEKELALNREDMRSITEDMEAANEELQSANEELQSSNEEMQSLNEELETSKEELQSTNEELIIVNQELFDKQEQLSVARIYSDSIVSTIRHPLIVLDKDLCIKTANAAFYKKFNVDEKETEKKWFYEIQHRQFDDFKLRSLLVKVVSQKDRIDNFEIVLNLPELGERTLLMNAQQIKNEKKAEQLILLAIEDVTERKLAEQKLKTFAEELEKKVKERTAALKESNEELKQTNTQLDQFAHVASHDLQEPLRKILTFSMRLQDDYKDELNTEAKMYLNKIEGASSRMKILIKDLLNYSRLLEHEKLFVKTDLNETLKNILNDFELLVDEKKAQIKFDELPAIEAIPLQMNQLFYNLISNALKFSREDVPPVITITSRTLSEKQMKKYPTFNPSVSYVEIIFTDNGIGFEQKYSEKIFTIFQRLHNRDTFIGTGIGLALTKKITENHHGVTFADGKENKGATFHVILPFKQSH